MTDSAVPLLKWPGGKRRVLPEIRKHIPETFDTYYEPFFGGGAVFFDLKPKKAVLADINSELVNLYQTVQSDPKQLIVELKKLASKNTQAEYLKIREQDREASFSKVSSAEKAARTIYLNRTCFNGLYRVNSKGHFNVPYGFYDNPKILDEENILAAHKLFTDNDVTIKHSSFEGILDEIDGVNNFIYLDPPYIPLSATSSFVGYSKEGFGLEQQRNLAERAYKKFEEGNTVLISNSDTPVTRELYSSYTIHSINVKRAISAKAGSRIAVGEVLAYAG